MGLLADTQNSVLRMRRDATAAKLSRHASRHVRDARPVLNAGVAN